MDQEFLDRLETAGFDKKKLTALLNELDQTKRSIRSQLSQLSSEPNDSTPVGRERQTRIRKMKDKISFITEEREVVRKRLAEIKANISSANRMQHKYRNGFELAFLVAAEQSLDEKQFLELEAQAHKMLSQMT
ncbi:hypothetical protein DC915_RS03140 [Vibrio parahaemolyticus]|nr:hypothetical protein [Vibrio parahaemolyticus]EJG0009975.1 hypothetical protein [Vibrio parahaemolyticus]